MVQWIIAIIALLLLGMMIYADTLTGKRKHSYFFYHHARTPRNKEEKEIIIPAQTPHEKFYAKINRVEPGAD